MWNKIARRVFLGISMPNGFWTKARMKIREAEYFLERMRSTKGKHEFGFNLSAFLGAARSVTFYLKKEHGGNELFDAWYEKKISEMSEVFEFLKESRNYVQKEGYVHSSVTEVVVNKADASKEIEEAGNVSGGGTLVVTKGPDEWQSVTDHELSDGIDGTSKLDKNQEYYFESLPEKEVPEDIADTSICDVCEEYLDDLNDIVSRWESFLHGDIDASELGVENG